MRNTWSSNFDPYNELVYLRQEIDNLKLSIQGVKEQQLELLNHMHKVMKHTQLQNTARQAQELVNLRIEQDVETLNQKLQAMEQSEKY